MQEFEFLEVLGHGGFGITYKGWNTTLEKTVAIKEFMPADIAIRESDRSVQPKTDNAETEFRWGLDRFLDEARMLARFDHPGIVRVQQFFEAHGTAYIVMEYLEGQTLGALYEDRKVLDEQQLRVFLEPILDALEQVHEADFLHRDIKPSNVMFRQGTVPVLIDFGAARVALAMRSQTMTAIVTPGFSPIEQYSASSESKQGPWTDIYAVGAVLYRGMTGIVPSDATTRIMDDRMTPVAEAIAGRYSNALVDAVEWSLQMRGVDRPQSISDWRRVLNGGSSPNTFSGAKSVEIVRAPAGKHLSGRIKWLVGVGLITAMTVGSIAYWWNELAESGFVLFNNPGPSNSEVEQLMLDGIARVRALVEEGEMGAARSALEEVAAKGLDDARRLVLESEIAEAERRSQAAQAQHLMAECEGYVESGRLAAALDCYRRVLALDADHEEALARVRRIGPLVGWKKADEERTVEGYYGFSRTYPESTFAPLVRHRLDELESEYWRSIEGSGDESKYLRYLEIYPDGRYSSLARVRSSQGE